MALTWNQQAHRQWLDTFILTKNPRHLKTATACQRIATAEIGAEMAAAILKRIERDAAQCRRMAAEARARDGHDT